MPKPVKQLDLDTAVDNLQQLIDDARANGDTIDIIYAHGDKGGVPGYPVDKNAVKILKATIRPKAVPVGGPKL